MGEREALAGSEDVGVLLPNRYRAQLPAIGAMQFQATSNSEALRLMGYKVKEKKARR